MPIYEYQCKKCQHQFETIQKFSEEPLKRCPECGKLSLKKLVSRAAFRLKGGGWYETDFKSGGKKNVAGDTASSGNSDSSKDSSGSTGKESSSDKSTSESSKPKSSDSESKAKSEPSKTASKSARKSTSKRKGKSASE